MLEIFQPLEIADSHTTSIAEDVRQKFDAFGHGDSLSFDCGGTVGCLNNDAALESVSVEFVN